MPKDARRYLKYKRDYWWKKAKSEGYISRAAYKLIQINERFRIIRRGYRCLDLGAAPGGRTQVLSELVGPAGEVVAVDIRPLKFKADNVKFIRSDIRDLNPEKLGKFDVVLSDLSPNLSGHYSLDQARQLLLAMTAYEIARKTLKYGGVFITKLFYGDDVQDFVRRAKGEFKFAKLFKPKASRNSSSEIYLVAVGFGKNVSDRNCIFLAETLL